MAVAPIVATQDGDLACSQGCYNAYQQLMELCDYDVEKLRSMPVLGSGYSGSSGISGVSGTRGSPTDHESLRRSIRLERDRMWCQALIMGCDGDTNVISSVTRQFNQLRRKNGEEIKDGRD